MASSTIDNRVVGQVFAVVNKNGPKVDEDEQHNVCHFLQRENKREDMVWDRLRKSVKRVESMASVWRRHNPLVVRLVKVLVDEWMMEVSMNPVNAEICEEQEERELKDVVPHSWSLLCRVVKIAIPPYFK